MKPYTAYRRLRGLHPRRALLRGIAAQIGTFDPFEPFPVSFRDLPHQARSMRVLARAIKRRELPFD